MKTRNIRPSCDWRDALNSADNSTQSILIAAGIAAIIVLVGLVVSKSAQRRNARSSLPDSRTLVALQRVRQSAPMHERDLTLPTRSSFGRLWTGIIVVAFGLLVASVIASAVSGNWTPYLAAVVLYTAVFLASIGGLGQAGVCRDGSDPDERPP